MTLPNLFTAEQREQLQANDRASMADETFDPQPVVKLFAPDGAAVWLLTELAADGDTAFGLCDLGLGFPEIGVVSLSEISGVRGKLGLPIERDQHFHADASLETYAERAREAGRITA